MRKVKSLAFEICVHLISTPHRRRDIAGESRSDCKKSRLPFRHQPSFSAPAPAVEDQSEKWIAHYNETAVVHVRACCVQLNSTAFACSLQ